MPAACLAASCVVPVIRPGTCRLRQERKCVDVARPYDREVPVVQGRPVALRIAASVQRTLEEAMRSLHAETVSLSGSPNTCLAGGVALNCVSNGRLPEPLYVPPFPHDAGVSLGAAWAIAPPARPVPLESPYLGGTLEARQQADQARTDGLHVEPFVPEAAAELLLNGAIGAVAEGRAEAGPRALGHRSIIAIPRPAGVRDRINALKGREPWRPLAPVTFPDYAPRGCGVTRAVGLSTWRAQR